MIARITRYKMRKDARDSALETLERLKPQIMALPGLTHFINTMDEDGNGYVVSIVSDREQSQESADKVKALWAEFGRDLESREDPVAMDVVADWQTAGAHA